MSGYLISSILSRRPSLTQFYKRRFIRIVPVYAAMLLVVVVSVFKSLQENQPKNCANCGYIEEHCRISLRSYGFRWCRHIHEMVSDLCKEHSSDSWVEGLLGSGFLPLFVRKTIDFQTSEFSQFLHTWSLAVEVK